MGDYPDSLVALQPHVGDNWANTWTWARWNFYDGYYVPRVQVDGLVGLVGSGEGSYSNMKNHMLDRLAIPTNVTIELYGDLVENQTYLITAVLYLEEGAAREQVRVHLIDCLFDWPYNTDGRYNNGVKQGFDLGYQTLNPGEETVIQQEVTFDGESWQSQDDIRIGFYAHEPLGSGPAEVYQAEMIAWPFPSYDMCPGDIDDDGVVDTADLLALLAAWGNTSGPEDINGDGLVNTADLLQLLSEWGQCP
ncbi:MAG: hypothetical protein SYC29_04890 [Planctomycetota bacterium]|nr:hypothetical protein [Planctomycetota bacterium]